MFNFVKISRKSHITVMDIIVAKYNRSLVSQKSHLVADNTIEPSEVVSNLRFALPPISQVLACFTSLLLQFITDLIHVSLQLGSAL